MKFNSFAHTKRKDYFDTEFGLLLEDMHDENVIAKDDVLIFNQYAHGNDDYNKVGEVTYRFQFFDNRQKLYDCIAAHFETIKENPDWKELFSINMTDLVQSDEDQFTINPEELKRRMDDFLRKHELHYNRLVEQLTDIFQSYGHT